jgi:hypothetical protein
MTMLNLLLLPLLWLTNLFTPDGDGGGDGDGGPSDPPPADPPADPKPKDKPDAAPKPGSAAALAAENQPLKDALPERDRKDREAEEERLRKQGEHQTLAERMKEERDAAKAQVQVVARRAAFISAASSGGISDPMAAYHLAHADGLLDKVAVDAEGVANTDQAGEAVKAVKAKYPSLFGRQQFGRGHQESGSEPTDKRPASGISTRERFRRGFEDDPAWGRMVDNADRRR